MARAAVSAALPAVLLDEFRMLMPTDIGVTAGAAMGHLDLAPWLIRKASPELACHST
ncbi:hypothetical protein [Mesorhizobium silamurunense]|uniref:hypothetical protein n=1 Tax=Mesorhizobium silamurunense TaxID=499528 RepID=UPI001FE91CA0|nr:hypothetical protein [Mesorhizobium silamurunense]